MKNYKFKNKSFFWTLLGNNIIFALAMVIILFVTIYLTVSVIIYYTDNTKIENVKFYQNIFKNQNYLNFNAERILGKNSFFDVVDEQYNIVYRSKKSTYKEYTKGEIECIRDFNSANYITLDSSVSKNGETQLIVKIENIQNRENENLIILNTDLSVLYSSKYINKKSYSEKEFGYFVDTYPINYTTYKYQYTAKDGKQYTAIFQLSRNSKNFMLRHFPKIIVLSIVIYLILALLVLILLTKWSMKKVKKPLNLLDKALIDFADGKRNDLMSYNVPLEFINIFDTFNTMSERLIKSEKEKRRIISDISHDLKTPITVIQGFSKALFDNKVLDEEKKEYLTTIYKKSVTLVNLINSFNEFTKLSHPSFNLQLEETDICEYLRSYLANKYNEITFSKFNIEIKIPDEKLICKVNKHQLSRVFDNLIANCIKYNNIHTTILFKIENKENKVKIIVADDGVGIPEGMYNSIFTEFVVVDNSRNNKQGSGLGLSIAKKIIEAHDGYIILRKPQIKGYSTEFIIILKQIIKLS